MFLDLNINSYVSKMLADIYSPKSDYTVVSVFFEDKTKKWEKSFARL